MTKPIVIKAIPAGLQVVTTARLTADGQNCQVATDQGPVTDFPQIGWTAQIEAEAKPTLTFANVSGCDFVGTGQRHTILRSGFVDITPGGFPNPINRSSKGVVPVAILGSENLDVRTIDVATIEIDDDRIPGGGVVPTARPKKPRGSQRGWLRRSRREVRTIALNQAGLLGNKRLFITGSIGNGAAQVLGSDAVCLPANCAQ